MKPCFGIILASLFTFSAVRSYGQGCSDAGVCSVGSLGLTGQFQYQYLPPDETKLALMPVYDPDAGPSNKSDSSYHISTGAQVATAPAAANPKPEKQYYYRFPKYFFQLSASYGKGDERTKIITTQLEGNVRMGKKMFAQVKIPYSFVTGALANTQGLNDITISLTYIAFIREKSNWSLTGGMKFPTNTGNISEGGIPLPMVYQTSLGSIDALGGIKYAFKKWDLTLGYQHSFNANKNEYLHSALIGEESTYNNYFESRALKRADDAIFRFSRNFYYKKLSANAGFLFIYHTADDTYINAAGERMRSKGSQGLTLNVNLAGTIALSKRTDLILIYASPVVTRKARPDGLTRKFVTLAGLKYKIY